jgi:NADPH2:quinone reductase
MKSIRVEETGGPEVMKLQEMDMPEVGAGGVLIKVHAAGINPVDTYIRSGNYGSVNLPYTPGTDAAGIVEQVGAGVTRFKPGDRVYCAGSQTGTYAEYVLCQSVTVHPLPENATFRQGAAIGVPYATAYRALVQRAGARGGDRVLVHGASGGVGTAAVQIARALGMHVTGTAGTEDGMKLVREQGADHVYNHKEDDYLKRAFEEATGNCGYDVILEMLSNVNLDHDLDVLAKNGRVVVIGSRGRVEIDPRKTMGKDSSILGMTIMNADEADTCAIHAALVAGLANGTLSPIVERAFPLVDAAAAHEAVMQPGAYGQIVLVPDWG